MIITRGPSNDLHYISDIINMILSYRPLFDMLTNIDEPNEMQKYLIQLNNNKWAVADITSIIDTSSKEYTTVFYSILHKSKVCLNQMTIINVWETIGNEDNSFIVIEHPYYVSKDILYPTISNHHPVAWITLIPTGDQYKVEPNHHIQDEITEVHVLSDDEISTAQYNIITNLPNFKNIVLLLLHKK